MEEEICSIHKEHKKLQDKNTNIIKSVLKKQDELETSISNVSTSTCNDETPTWTSMSSLPPTYMVQTSNSFELLTGTDSDHDQEQTNKPTKTTEITEPNTESQYSPTTNKEDPESKKN